MHSPLPLLAAASLLALAACGKPAPQVVDTNPDPMANVVANAHVELPPSIKAEKTMRCKDNSLVYVTFFNGDKQALVKTDKAGTPTRLTAEEAGQPLIADGWSLTGTPASITLTAPGKAAQACKG